MDYFRLADTTCDVLDKMRVAEAEGRYNDHVDTIDYTNFYPVDENFPYVSTGKLKIMQGLLRIFPIAPFCAAVNLFILRTKVHGRKNLAGVKSAVVTCNHVNKLDAIAVRKAVMPLCGKVRQFKVMTADFNNQKGKLGEYMRAFGIMPFCAKHNMVRKFNKAVQTYCKNGARILFFPEQSEWWCYRRPRPLKDGAFYYAVKNNVPVLPVFITFEDRHRKSGAYAKSNACEIAGARAGSGIHDDAYAGDGIYDVHASSGVHDVTVRLNSRFHVHILPPIYAKKELSDRDNIRWMREENYRRWVEKYEEYYATVLREDREN